MKSRNSNSLLRSIHFVLALGAAALLSTGCQAIWASITSPSDWIAGSSRSISASIGGISRSSGTGGGSTAANERYRRDVRVFAAAFVETDGSSDDFLRGVGRIAESHGLSDWEGEPATLLAIGEGLRDAGVDAAGMEHLRSTLADVDPADVSLVMEGWAGAEASGS
jgi:hypothetical protein